MSDAQLGNFISPASIDDMYRAFRENDPDATEAQIAVRMVRWAESIYRMRMRQMIEPKSNPAKEGAGPVLTIKIDASTGQNISKVVDDFFRQRSA